MTAKLGTKLNDQRLMEKVRSILQDEAYREGSDQQLGELLISYLKGEIRIQKPSLPWRMTSRVITTDTETTLRCHPSPLGPLVSR